MDNPRRNESLNQEKFLKFGALGSLKKLKHEKHERSRNLEKSAMFEWAIPEC